MSGSSYPQGLDSFVPVADGDLITAALENQQTDAIMAIESTLGLDPGSGGTVAQALAGKLDKSGGSMGGDIAMASHRVTGLADPSSAQDAATKAYVLSQGFAMAATMAAGTYTKLTVNNQGVVTGGETAGVVDLSGAAPLDSPSFTGVPLAPTAAAGTSSTQLATTGFVHNALVAALPAGVIVPYGGGGTTPPTGWVFCDGSTLDGNEARYQALWSAIGTTYGGSGQSSFKVPDLRGRVPIGAGTATGATGATNHAMGSSGGEETHQLSSQEMPSHTHTATATDAGHPHGNIPLYTSSGSGDNLTWNPGAPRIWPNGNASTTTGYALVSVTNANTGGDANHNNMPPYLAINYLMKL